MLDVTNQNHKIHLQGIDAPEGGQAFGNRSHQNLSDLIFSKDVTIEWFKRDRYGRKVGKVLLDGSDVCLEQIKAGMAWHYKYYQLEQSKEDRELYAKTPKQKPALHDEVFGATRIRYHLGTFAADIDPQITQMQIYNFCL